MDDQFDPKQKLELAELRAEHQKRFQVMISYIKEKVGEGVEYRNDIVRIVVSDNGAYYELNDLPEEFSGAVGDHITRHFVAPREAIGLLTRAVEAGRHAWSARAATPLSIIALYTRRGLVDRKNCYIFDYHPTEEKLAAPREIGAFQPNVMPLFYKIRIDAQSTREALGIERGIVFCMANAGDRHLMIHIPFDGDQVTDLGDLPNPKVVH